MTRIKYINAIFRQLWK